jgi:phospholipase C
VRQIDRSIYRRLTTGVATSAALFGLFAQSSPALAASKIQHVVIIVQQSRSFDELFQGFPGADTQSYGFTSGGLKVPLRPVGLDSGIALAHDAPDFLAAFDGGKNDGFNHEQVNCWLPSGCHVARPQYSFIPVAQVQPYWSMAEQYVLGDRMFASTYDGEFQTHLQLISAQDYETIGIPTTRPWGCDNLNESTVVDRLRRLAPVFPCFDYTTLADELDAANVTWRAYSPGPNGDFGYEWQAFDAIKHIRYGPDWSNVVSPNTQFITDVGNGTLANVTWITPTLTTSDEGRSVNVSGPPYVASLVNAVGQSKFWDSTAIFVTWADYGGFYDHVPPPQDADQGRSFRVPLIVISPFVAPGRVTHTQYQHGSLLKFVEETFGVNPLSRLDARANSPLREFDFNRSPRTFTPITL